MTPERMKELRDALAIWDWDVIAVGMKEALDALEAAEDQLQRLRVTAPDIKRLADMNLEMLGSVAATRDLYARRAEAAEREAEALREDHVALMRISGILVDAGNIPVDPLPEGVLALRNERDEWKRRAEEAEWRLEGLSK